MRSSPGISGACALLLSLGSLLLPTCASAPARGPTPVLAALQSAPGRHPVVLVPGVTGTELRDRETGKLEWGQGANFLWPRDGGLRIALPIAPPAGQPPRLEPGRVIEEIRLAGLIRRQIYRPLVELMERNGYRQGELSAPRADDGFFLFAYDWRDDLLAAAARLAERLEALRRVRREERLRVTLICQSGGAVICRYLAKYGGAAVEEAEAGRAGPPARIEIAALVLVGTSNGGGVRILRELNRGRSYLPALGRWWSPETLFTFRSLFQDLPVYRRDLFFDEAGAPLEVDLFAPANWRRFGWSIYGRGAARRLEAAGDREALGTDPLRSSYLAEQLDRARRLHALLRSDPPGFQAAPIYLLQNRSEPTADGAVLARKDSGWKTYFTGDRWLSRRPRLERLVTADGDGHATTASQEWLSPRESDRVAEPAFEIAGEHFEMILATEARRKLLEILLETSDGDRVDPSPES